jgi:hypothetical protein
MHTGATHIELVRERRALQRAGSRGGAERACMVAMHAGAPSALRLRRPPLHAAPLAPPIALTCTGDSQPGLAPTGREPSCAYAASRKGMAVSLRPSPQPASFCGSHEGRGGHVTGGGCRRRCQASSLLLLKAAAETHAEGPPHDAGVQLVAGHQVRKVRDGVTRVDGRAVAAGAVLLRREHAVLVHDDDAQAVRDVQQERRVVRRAPVGEEGTSQGKAADSKQCGGRRLRPPPSAEAVCARGAPC